MEIGVGIDGGNVFYGTIGSNLRMTSTVIGDRVNAASRLEGLTRIYSIPLICSEYIKLDVERNIPDSDYHFVNIDRVQVKGKTQSTPIYWPLLKSDLDKEMLARLGELKEALSSYYAGEWQRSQQIFSTLSFPFSPLFIERTQGTPPHNWNGVWVQENK